MDQAVVTVYEKSTCTKCRETKKILDEMGVKYVVHEFHKDPLSEGKLKSLIQKMGVSARDILRTNEEIYRKLGLSKKDMSEDEIVSLMVSHPDLIQRPIVEKGEGAVLGRPPLSVRAFLSEHE